MRLTPATALIVGALLAQGAAEEPEFDPVAFYNQYTRGRPEEQALRIVPTQSKDVLTPPKEWETLRIDSISIQLPLSACHRASRVYTNALLLRFDGFAVSLTDLGPARDDAVYPPVSFGQTREMLFTTPAHLSLTNSEAQNRMVTSRLLVKAIAVAGDKRREFTVLETQHLNAVITRVKNLDGKGTSTFLQVWHPAGKVYFMVHIINEPSPSFALRVLGGIRFARDTIGRQEASQAINGVCERFAGKEKPKKPREWNATWLPDEVPARREDAVLACELANAEAERLYRLEPFSPEDFHVSTNEGQKVLVATVPLRQDELKAEVSFGTNSQAVVSLSVVTSRLIPE